MLRIELSEEEQKVLSEILENSLPKLDIEIHRTDKLEFKQALTQRREVVKQLLSRISESVRVPA